jgi:hypothetical protein
MTYPDERILVIRLSALGDIVQCFQAFHDIRRAHPKAHIALLTMPAFAGFAKEMPWFDRVIIDQRAPIWRIDLWRDLLSKIAAFNPTRVYDLQAKRRQNILYWLTGGPLGREWSGSAPFCTFGRIDPVPTDIHFTAFVADQLNRAGLESSGTPDLSWLKASINTFNLPPRYAVLVPGCGAGRDYKQWPVAHYAAIARRLIAAGYGVVTVGTSSDKAVVDALVTEVPDIIDLCGQTSLLQLGGLARAAVAVLGNDTGPTHLMAAVGAPTLALFSERVNAVWCAPRGQTIRWLQGHPLQKLLPDEVFLALGHMIDKRN